MDRIFSGPRVLVLEPDYFLAQDLADLIASDGGEVVGPFSSVQDALAGLQSSDRPDMAVISPDLRDGSAYYVIERLTSLGVTVAIASGDDRTIPECWAALPRLPKPVVRADLARFLRVSVGSAVA